VTASPHLRGIVIAGVLAAVALALGLATLAMNQTASRAATHPIVPLKLRHPTKVVHPKAAQPFASKKKAPAAPKPNPNLVAALKAGLPRSVARALAAHPVVVVQLTSQRDDVARLTSGEARSGAGLAGASFVTVDVDSNGGDVQTLTRLLGQLPIAPASLVYTRPAKLYVTLTGFNDRTTVQQAAANAATASAASPGAG
jgi:type IV secretory pathway VirB10-like protein